MVFFKNLSIRSKILSVVLLIALLEVIVAGSSFYFLRAIDRHMSNLADIDVARMRAASDVRTRLLEIHRAQKNSLLFAGKQLIQEQINRKHLYISRLSEGLSELDRFIGPQERYALRSLQLQVEQFLRTDKQIEEIVLADLQDGAVDLNRPQVVALSAGPARTAYDSATGLIQDLVKSSQASMEAHRGEAADYVRTALMLLIAICAATLFGGILLGALLARNIATNLARLVEATDAIAGGDLSARLEVQSGDETGELAASVQRMQDALQQAAAAAAARDYLKAGAARLNDAMRGHVEVEALCSAVVHEISATTDAQVGALFLLNGDPQQPMLTFKGGYAYSNNGACADGFALGEGLVGQAALNKTPMCIQQVPPEYVKVYCGLGETRPTCLTLAPLIYQEQVKGVVELGHLQAPQELQLEYLQQVLPAVAVSLENARGREDLAKALSRSQVLSEELLQQQEELKTANEELEEQTQNLRLSQERLREQQEELETVNSQLEEKNLYLETTRSQIEQSNRELTRTRLDIEEKAEQLAQSSRYKSEFLANMSHELRTPLNSILLLARLLSDNKGGTMTSEQVQSAKIILSSGNDLLMLINEVLDLAKIEAGRMELQLEQVDLQEVAEGIQYQFGHLIKEKKLELKVELEPECPSQLRTDRKRLGQILRNLLSNAVKFTEKGDIQVHFGRPGAQEMVPVELPRESTVRIAIRDTGIGIAPEQQRMVFEAFQQAESGAARKYSGTGLGLSISRGLAQLLGGEILLRSAPGLGSTFTLFLPEQAPAEQAQVPPLSCAEPGPPIKSRTPLPSPPPPDAAPVWADDRESLGDGDTTLLIIEDDPGFAKHLMELCRQSGCKVLYAATGEQGLALAEAYRPKGIFLDIRLPGRDGWSVLASLKDNQQTRHIPVHIVSVEDASMDALERGAVGFLTKPVEKADLEKALEKLQNVFSRPMKELLVVEDNEDLRRSIIALIGNSDVHSDEAGSAAEAMAALTAKCYDCMILDLGLPDANGMELLRSLERQSGGVHLPPVIVYTGRELTREQEAELRRYSESIIVKGVCSQERLLDEASLFLHRMVSKLPERKRKLITNLHDADVIFRDKKVLIVDDDMRNVFALSKLLEEKGVVTLKAENGQKALELLDSNEAVDLILIDMMMPVMDGYETMRRIRAQERFRDMPMIALTAKAMAQDRARCIEAGASDYLSKPVDMMRLFSMMRVWLYR